MAGYLIAFTLGWSACSLFVAIAEWRPSWIFGKRREH